MNREVPVNGRIRARNVRIVDENGQQLGVMTLRDALAKSTSEGLDLIQISNGEVPVCRIGDAGKYLFERKKNLREQAKRQREMIVDVKEVQLRPVTDINDILIKARRANEFLTEGDKVKVVVRFRGRERAHKELGHKIVKEFLSHLTEYRLERPIADNDREFSALIAPMKSKAEVLKDRK